MRYTALYLLFFVSVICSCNNKDKEIKFDKANWNQQEDQAFTSPYRRKMINDLTVNNKLVGMKYSQLVKFLGIPDFKDSSSLSYKIIEDYGGDIDPVYTKDLTFIFSKDSTITAFKLVEWRKPQ